MDKNLLELKGIRPLLLLLGLLSLGQGAAVIAQALWLAEAVALLFQGSPAAEAVKPLIWFALAFAARHTFVWLQRLWSGRFAESTSEHLRLQLLERLFERGPAYAAQNGSGRLVTLALDGVSRFRTYVELFLPRMLDMLFVTVSLLAAVYMLDLASGLILTFTMPVLILFFILLGLAARKLADKQWRSYQVLSRHFTDTLRGLETLRFLGRSKSYTETIERVSERYRSATMRTLRTAFFSSFALDFFSTLSVAFVAVGLGLRLINGTVGLEAALAVLLLAPEFFTPVRMLGSDYHASLDGKEAWGAMHKIFKEDGDSKTDARKRKQESLEEQQTAEESLANEETDEEIPEKKKRDEYKLGPLEGEASGSAVMGNDWANVKSSCDTEAIAVELNDVSVRSDEGSLQLSAINAALTGDKRKIGIVGMSGAGKTTLLQLIGGFLQPASGTVMVGGRPLKGRVLKSWQKEIAFIPQQPYLFSGSLADNVRFYDPDISDERIVQVLDEVGLLKLVSKLPKGIYEPIGEGGRALSGGQAQRVMLARALAGNRSVLLLDEPTAHLDIETELALKETMLSIFGDRLVFLATHRLHWMKEMDWILVIDKGRLVETGTHEQLKRRNSYYSELLTAASGGGRV